MTLYVDSHPQNLSGSMSSAFGAAKNRMSGSVSQQVIYIYLLLDNQFNCYCKYARMHLYCADMHLHYVDILMDFLQKEYIYSAFV